MKKLIFILLFATGIVAVASAVTVQPHSFVKTELAIEPYFLMDSDAIIVEVNKIPFAAHQSIAIMVNEVGENGFGERLCYYYCAVPKSIELPPYLWRFSKCDKPRNYKLSRSNLPPNLV